MPRTRLVVIGGGVAGHRIAHDLRREMDVTLATDRFLRLQGHPRLFVAGDVTDLPEGRLAMVASFHVPVIVANLRRLAKAVGWWEEAPLKADSPKVAGRGLGRLMIVSSGRRDGLTSLPFGRFRWPLLARKLKSEQLFVRATRQGVGLT